MYHEAQARAPKSANVYHCLPGHNRTGHSVWQLVQQAVSRFSIQVSLAVISFLYTQDIQVRDFEAEYFSK